MALTEFGLLVRDAQIREALDNLREPSHRFIVLLMFDDEEKASMFTTNKTRDLVKEFKRVSGLIDSPVYQSDIEELRKRCLLCRNPEKVVVMFDGIGFHFFTIQNN